MRACLRFVLAVAALALGVVPPTVRSAAAQPALALPDVCYATLGNNASDPGALITVDTSTGTGTLIGATGIVGQFGDLGVPALAIKTTGEIFAMGIGPASKLYLIDAATGAATLVASTTLNSPSAIAFDGSDVLWAVDGSGKIFVVDDSTGDTFLVGSAGVFLKGMAFDPTDGSLWGSDASRGIFTINIRNGHATLVGDTGQAPSPDICFDAAGVLYASSGGGLASNNLISIDKATGVGTVLGPIGFASVTGMAARLDRKIVPVLVPSYVSIWKDDHVELRWSLLVPPETVTFEVLRAKQADPFQPLLAVEIRSSADGFVLVDYDVQAEATYSYRVLVFQSGSVLTSFETSVSTPRLAISLEQNHPNPFNPRTQIQFAVARQGRVSLRVFDLSGRLVRTLLDRTLSPGTHTESWDGRDDHGGPVAGGTYLYRLTMDWQVLTKKAVLLK